MRKGAQLIGDRDSDTSLAQIERQSPSRHPISS
jgi:hypothetical protein